LYKKFKNTFQGGVFLELHELKADIRESTGNGYARALRRQGQMPAVIYGKGVEPVKVSVNTRDLELLLKKNRASQVLMNLVVGNMGTPRSAMIKELQVDPTSRNFLHVDFYEVDMTKKIKVKVPVATTGISKGVELGGILQLIRKELEVMCLPQEIPNSIDIDVTDLNVGDSIHINEISAEGNIEFPPDVNFTVVTVVAPKREVEEVTEEEAAEEEAVEAEAGGGEE
jgi:large subunit ribosomal protein L25